MANISDASGTIIFSHPTASPALLEEFITHGQDHFTYGALHGGDLSYIEDTAAWNKVYQFNTTGRWSFLATIEHYFEKFDELYPADQLHGLTLNITEYVDYEGGSSLFEKGSIKIKAVYDNVKHEITTQVCDKTTLPIAINANNLEHYGICETAWDTFSEYGAESLYNIFKHYNSMIALNSNVGIVGLLAKLISDIDNLSPAMLRKVFIDEQVYHQTIDCDDLEFIEDYFAECDLLDHPLLKKYN